MDEASLELIVHLDCKGLPLAPAYLCERLADFRAAGATGVLLEWEDMLPFDGELSCISCKYAFTREDIAAVVETADGLGLEVVPLLQTLGHCEYMLKHESLAHLREDHGDYGTLCPSAAADLLEEALSQVLQLHPHSKRVHIGCDEPTIGAHPLTKAAASDEPDGLGGVFVRHIARMTTAARARGCTCLMWHDAAVGLSEGALEQLLETGAQLVVWDYRSQLHEDDPSLRFAARLCARAAVSNGAVPRPLIATAFKGGDACDAITPHEGARLANQSEWKAWMYPGGGSQPREIGGVVLTGWSRFGHLLPLCEMLPAAMPVLLQSLSLWRERSGLLAAEKSTQAVARWQSSDDRGSALRRLCTDLDRASTRVSAVEEELKTNTKPSTARRPAPKLANRLNAEAISLVSNVTQIDAQFDELMSDADPLFQCDAMEWRQAKITHLLGRAQRIQQSSHELCTTPIRIADMSRA